MTAAISDLRHRVTIQASIRTDDGGGGGTVEWIDEGRIWAHVEPLSGFQRLKAEQLEATLTHSVTIRYRADVLAGMRFNYGGRLLLIHTAIDEDERRRWLVLMCEEIKER